MTLIEFFDKIPVENIISSLALKPDRVVFVSSDSRKVVRAVPTYQKLLSGRGIRLETRVKIVSKNDIDGIMGALYGIISDADEDYVIDISGGDESSLVALGIVLGNTERRVAAFRINAATRRAVWFDVKCAEDGGGGCKLERTSMDFSGNSQVYLTARENILLHGGKIYGESVTFSRGDPVCGDIERLWEVCRRDCGGWNAKINRFSAAVTASGAGYVIRRESIGKKSGVDRSLWKFFVDGGFIILDEERCDGDTSAFTFTYKSKPVQDCLTKAGSLFEYYTYKTALECEVGGEAVFSSATTGVILGWSGEGGTRNEIDVMLMHGVTPIFISCKNGDVKTDELYKLAAVSEKFGSSYAKCALAATIYFDSTGDSSVENLKSRAEDMSIKVIGSIHRLSKSEFKELLIGLIK